MYVDIAIEMESFTNLLQLYIQQGLQSSAVARPNTYGSNPRTPLLAGQPFDLVASAYNLLPQEVSYVVFDDRRIERLGDGRGPSYRITAMNLRSLTSGLPTIRIGPGQNNVPITTPGAPSGRGCDSHSDGCPMGFPGVSQYRVASGTRSDLPSAPKSPRSVLA